MAELRPRSPFWVRAHAVAELLWEIGGVALAIFLIVNHPGKWFANPELFWTLFVVSILAVAFPFRYKHGETVLSVDIAGGPMIAAVLLIPRSEALLIVLLSQMIGSIRLGRKFGYFCQNLSDIAAAYSVTSLIWIHGVQGFSIHAIQIAFLFNLTVYLISTILLQSWLCINQGFSFVAALNRWTVGRSINQMVEFLVCVVMAGLLSSSWLAFAAFVSLGAIVMKVLRRSIEAENDRDKLHALFNFASRTIDDLTPAVLAEEVARVAQETLPYETISLQNEEPSSELASVYLWEVDGKPTWLVGTRYYKRGDNAGQIFEWFTVLAESSKRILENLLLQEQLRDAALHDELTGLDNRRLFDEHLSHAIAHAERRRLKAALLFVDLNNFKGINDTFGHEVGDQLLKTLAARFRSELRAEDILARIGGDEFVFLFPSVERRDIEIFAKRILELSKETVSIGNSDPMTVSGSIGIALYPDNARNSDELLRAADQAMYKAKDSRSGMMWSEERSSTDQTESVL
jgi:diguanylate cyclase (GGDEF)-like protein